MAHSRSLKSGKSVPASVEMFSEGFGERLAEVIDSVGSLVVSAGIAGVTTEQVARWRDGVAKPNAFALGALADGAMYSLHWLVTGRGPQRLAEHVESPTYAAGDLALAVRRSKEMLDEANRAPLFSEFALIPRYDVQASAGSGVVAVDETEIERIAFRRDWLHEIGLDPNEAGLLTAVGDSMSPTIPDGALMLVDRRSNQQLRSGYIYVIVLDGEVLVKRLSRNVDKTIDLISDNPLYPVKTIRQVDFDGLFIAGRVFWVGRKL